jgi:nucleotide-binding universal stress UspA family protein
METFSVKFTAGSLELAAIVTAFDHHQQFKIEMVTKEPEPIRLRRSVEGNWTVIQKGARNLSDLDLESLQKAIDARLDEIYGVKSMLVLTDFSDTSLNAARYAARLSHQLQTTKMILYHSLNSSTSTKDAEHQEKINDLKNELQHLVAGRTEIVIRSDERSLLTAVNALAEQEDIGLVVTGTTGRNQFEKVMMGSNVIRLAEECIAPLLIVPPSADFKTIQKVVFACDLRQVSKTTPLFAIKTFIHTVGAKSLILNVDRKENFNPEKIGELTDLQVLWNEEKPEYHYIQHEDVASGIMEFAEEQGADLVITVPKVYGFFESIFHRSLTKKLAYHSRLPLVLFRADA